MYRFLWISFLIACEPATVVFTEVVYSDSGIPMKPGLEPTSEPTSEPPVSTEPTSEPTEPTSEPTSEPSQEEPLPPVDFSDFVEDELGMSRGSSGLDSIEGNLTLWLDAQKMSTLTRDSSNNIMQWDNRSDNPNHAVQSDSNVRPGYDGVEMMIDFNGSHYFFVENQIVDVDTTYFVIYKGSNPVGTLFAKANETGIWSRGGKTFFIRNNRYTTDVGWVGYYNADTEVSTVNASIGTFEHRENGNNDSHLIYYNGVLELQDNWTFNVHSEEDLQNGGIFKIGYTSTDFPQDHGLYGKIGEIIKIDQTISSGLRATIHAYLASKWGISSEVDSDNDGSTDNIDSNPIDANYD